MNIDPMAAMEPRSADTSQGAKPDQAPQTNEMFLQLLMTQLKNQRPLDPMDPTQFVAQLVQFNSLNELIQIREMLQQVTGTPS